jgi:Ca-activated chloride channel homolog
MKWIRYSKYSGEDLGIDAQDLLKALSDFLLESGFNTQYMPFSEWNQHTLEELKKAIQQALEEGRMFDDQSLQEMMERLQNMTPEQMDKLLENLV